MMKIGIPKEIKVSESRVALLPKACAELTAEGHKVFFEKGCGELSGYDDQEYIHSGCTIIDSQEALYETAELIVKVKEPQVEEYSFLNKDHTLFCFLHLAANPNLTKILTASQVTAIAFEEVTDDEGNLPLLKPMSIIAGKLAAQYASIYLHSNYGGRGILVDSIDSADKPNITILGYGVSGSAAAEHFMGIGSSVTIVDKNEDKLYQARQLSENVATLLPTASNYTSTICTSEVLIGAVLVPGMRAPVVVKSDWVKKMPKGAVIVDIAVDQGGCIETTRPTTYEDPIYTEYGVTHFAVQNIPAAVPRTASQLISNSILPHVKSIAADSWRLNTHIVAGLCIEQGKFIG